MNDVSAWVGIGLTALALTVGCVAYVHAMVSASDRRTEEKVRELHTRISGTNNKTDGEVSDLEGKMTQLIAAERGDRRREIDRVEKVLEGFSHIASAVVGMGKSIEHLADSLRSHQNHTDKSLEEVKHTVRAIDMKMRGIGE